MGAVLLHPVRDRILKTLDEILAGIRKKSPRIRGMLWLMVISVSILLFWLARERVFLLGDGNLVARTLPVIHTPEGIPPSSFRNAPFATYVTWSIYNVFKGLGIAEPNVRAFQWMSILFGAGSVLVVIKLAGLLSTDALERMLIAIGIIGSAGVQLFFGYVESYAIVYFGCLLFFTLALGNIRNNISPVFPSLAFGALLATHLGAVSMLPLFLYLLIVCYRRNGFHAVVVSMAASLITTVFLLWLSGYRAPTAALIVAGGGDHLLPMFGAATNMHAYTIFSPWHFVDIANLMALLSPFSLPACMLMAVALFSKGMKWDPTWKFLILAIICSIVFTFSLNSALGMSRDWDLLASFNLSLVIVFPILCSRWIRDIAERRRALIVVSAVALLSTCPWIAVNAGEDTSLARFENLPNANLWSTTALLNAYDELSALHRDKKDYGKSLDYGMKYLTIDSGNARIHGKIADIYGLMGDEDHQLTYYQNSIRHGFKNWGLFIKVGVMLADRQRYDEAIDITKKSLELNPLSAVAWNNLGHFYVGGSSDFTSALSCFRRALEIDSTNVRGYVDAGRCCYYLGDDAGMRVYFERYARMTAHPLDAEEIKKLIGPTPPPKKR